MINTKKNKMYYITMQKEKLLKLLNTHIFVPSDFKLKKDYIDIFGIAYILLKDNFRILQPRPYFPVPMSKRLLEF